MTEPRPTTQLELAIPPPDDGRIVGPDDDAAQADASGVLAVLKNRNFLLLWLAQVATQIGGNMVVYGLTVLVFSATKSNSAVSLLLLTFLAPAVFFSAVAGVYVDRLDRRIILIVTNLLRAIFFALVFVANGNLAAIFILNIAISTVTTFFAPAEAAMIPELVPRRQLLAANGLFTFTQNVAFALGFALLGPLVVKVAGPEVLILTVAILYLVAMVFVITLPSVLPATAGTSAGFAVHDTERAVASVFGELREGLSYIRAHRNITWSLIYLGITASLIGVLGVLGPDFATETLGLAPTDFVVVVLPLGMGVVTGILLLNSYGKLLPAPPVDGRRPRRPRAAAHRAGRGRSADPVPPAGRGGHAARPVRGGLAAGGRGRDRVPGRHRLRARRDPGPDEPPGGPARGGPRPGVRRPEHALVGRELRPDHRRRDDLRLGRDDRRDRHRGRVGHDRRGRVGGDPQGGDRRRPRQRR